MIVSITFRHNTENTTLRQWVNKHCWELATNMNGITRIHVIFSKEFHDKQPLPSIQCHISVQATKRRHFDVYVRKNDDGSAFNGAFERMKKKISRLHFNRKYCRTVMPINADNDCSLIGYAGIA